MRSLTSELRVTNERRVPGEIFVKQRKASAKDRIKRILDMPVSTIIENSCHE